MYSALEEIVVYTWAYMGARLVSKPALGALLYSVLLWLTRHTLYLGPEQWAKGVVLLSMAQAMGNASSPWLFIRDWKSRVPPRVQGEG